MSYLKVNLPKLLFTFVILISIPVTLFLVGRATNFFSRAFGVKANIVIDWQETTGDRTYPWRNFSQGGEEKGNMIAPVVDKVSALKPEYIRIDHIYDYYDVISKDPSGNITFDWTKLDAVVSDILKTGAKPFLSLSYMPLAISSGNENDLPNSWNDWQFIVQKTIEHYSGKSNLAIPDVYYEVWNEPDLFGQFRTYGDKDYLDLYYYSSLGASVARDTLSFKLGGPSTTDLYNSWFGKFLEFVTQNNLKFDFYSWHKYTTDIDEFEKDVSRVKLWSIGTFENLKNVEFMVTEVGPNSINDSSYDNNFGAIHSLAVASTLDGGQVSRVFTFEIKDGHGSQKYWGRWGLLTNEQFGPPEEKPRYKAFQFLNQLAGERINLEGEGSWVKATARREGSTLKVLVVNYDPSGKHSETVPLTFDNIPSQDFTYRKIDFLGSTKERVVTNSASSWQVTEYFAPNSASILELTF